MKITDIKIISFKARTRATPTKWATEFGAKSTMIFSESSRSKPMKGSREFSRVATVTFYHRLYRKFQIFVRQVEFAHRRVERECMHTLPGRVDEHRRKTRKERTRLPPACCRVVTGLRGFQTPNQ
jgi:hypothetical protein